MHSAQQKTNLADAISNFIRFRHIKLATLEIRLQLRICKIFVTKSSLKSVSFKIFCERFCTVLTYFFSVGCRF